VLRALAKEPKERFTTVEAFVGALQQACQTTLSRPMAFLSEFAPTREPLPLADTMISSPSSQISRLSNAASFSISKRSGYENTPPVPELRKNTVIGNRLKQIGPGKIVLLVGFILLVLVGSLGLFNMMRSNQRASDHAPAPTATQAPAAATATARYNDYIRATSGTPVLDDPLDSNRKGNGWAEGNGSCVFSGGQYHVKISQTGYFQACFAQPTLHFSNFAFQVQMTILSGDYGGIVFRTNEGHPFGYRFAFGSGSNNLVYDYELAKFANIQANLNQVYLLTVIACGRSISLYIDKQWVATAEDSSAILGALA